MGSLLETALDNQQEARFMADIAPGAGPFNREFWLLQYSIWGHIIKGIKSL